MNEIKKIITILVIAVVAIIGVILLNIATQKENEKIMNDYKDLKNSKTEQLIYIGRPTCSYCQQLSPVLEEITDMYQVKYHYLNKKVVEMKLQEKTPLPSVQGITVLKENGYRLKLEVDTAKIKINEALRYIDTEQVEDINISNIPLENIIMEIYKSEGRAQAAL